jgi:hypothetical protein
MMTEQELQGLSRWAAECLLKTDFDLSKALGLFTGDTSETKLLGKQLLSFTVDEETGGFPTLWLHESTEACAEIMVRVLWPAAVYLDKIGAHTVALHYQSIGSRKWSSEMTIVLTGDDPMLAFRVAVLKALIALKGE